MKWPKIPGLKEEFLSSLATPVLPKTCVLTQCSALCAPMERFIGMPRVGHTELRAAKCAESPFKTSQLEQLKEACDFYHFKEGKLTVLFFEHRA